MRSGFPQKYSQSGTGSRLEAVSDSRPEGSKGSRGSATQWKELAEAVDAQMNPPKKVWVPFNGSNCPKPGDIYSLLQHEDRSKFQHVGIFVKEEGDTWITADGGTGENGYQGGWNHRKFQSSGEIQGEKGNLAWIAGWVDLDNLYAVAREAFPK